MNQENLNFPVPFCIIRIFFNAFKAAEFGGLPWGGTNGFPPFFHVFLGVGVRDEFTGARRANGARLR